MSTERSHRCIFQISLKYIKLVLPKILFILVLCNFNFYLKLCENPQNFTIIEALAVSMKMYSEKILSFLVYRPPRQEVSTFIYGMISIFRDNWKGELIVQLGNFNLCQMLPENINRLVVDPLKKDL